MTREDIAELADALRTVSSAADSREESDAVNAVAEALERVVLWGLYNDE